MAKKGLTTTIVTNNISEVRDVLTGIGDKLVTQHQTSKDLKVIQTAIQAYSTAVAASKAQLIYKKLTGGPASIAFFETAK